MKKMFAAALFAVAVLGAVTLLAPPAMCIDCSIVRCPGCPEGYQLKPSGNNCCRCVAIHH